MRLLSSKAALGSYVNHTQRDARLCISIRPTLLFFFKHMHWIISHHILQSGACQCGVAMTTSSVPPPPPIYTHTPPLPPSFSTFSSHHHSSSSLATNRTEKNKAWEKKHFVGWNKNGGMMEERKGKEMLCSWLEQQLVFSLIVLQFGCFGGCREFFLSVRGWLCVCVFLLLSLYHLWAAWLGAYSIA